MLRSLIFILFISLFPCCKEVDKLREKAESEAAIARDVRVTLWYHHQMASMDSLDFDKYSFNKIEHTPYTILNIQKEEIKQFYENGKLKKGKKEKILNWLEYQKEAANDIGMKIENIEQLNIENLNAVITIIDDQEKYIKQNENLAG